jgi:hypothetical protein
MVYMISFDNGLAAMVWFLIATTYMIDWLWWSAVMLMELAPSFPAASQLLQAFFPLCTSSILWTRYAFTWRWQSTFFLWTACVHRHHDSESACLSIYYVLGCAVSSVLRSTILQQYLQMQAHFRNWSTAGEFSSLHLITPCDRIIKECSFPKIWKSKCFL